MIVMIAQAFVCLLLPFYTRRLFSLISSNSHIASLSFILLRIILNNFEWSTVSKNFLISHLRAKQGSNPLWLTCLNFLYKISTPLCVPLETRHENELDINVGSNIGLSTLKTA